MNKLPAHVGWLWVRRGFALFRKQPLAMMTLFLTYMLLIMLVGVIPLLGQVLPMVLVPAFSIGFLRACAALESDEPVRPGMLFTGLRSPSLPRLLQLGVLHLLAIMLAVAIATLVDDGSARRMFGARGPIDPKTVDLGAVMLSALTGLLAYTPASMALWFAAPLVHWQKMPVAKALFFSFVAFWRALGAFTVFGLGWFLVGVLLPTIASLLVAMLVGSVQAAMLMLVPVSITLTVVMYCSFYPTYTDVFGPLEPKPQPVPGPSQDPDEPPFM